MGETGIIIMISLCRWEAQWQTISCQRRLKKNPKSLEMWMHLTLNPIYFPKPHASF